MRRKKERSSLLAAGLRDDDYFAVLKEDPHDLVSVFKAEMLRNLFRHGGPPPSTPDCEGSLRDILHLVEVYLHGNPETVPTQAYMHWYETNIP